MATTSTASATARQMAASARAFLSTLTPEQRAKATFGFDLDERENWHFIPRPREGLPRGEMNGEQLEASDSLMASGLSSRAYRQVKDIIDLEVILGEVERRAGRMERDRAPGLYYFSVFGEPGGREPWGWRVEGHHLSLNLTVVDGEVVSPTPSFFGANPAEVKYGPQKGLRILRDEEELARGLLLSLDPGQRHRAVIYPVAPAEILTRASRRVEIDQPAGLPAGLMTADQRENLMSLIKVYIERKAEEVATNALKKIEAGGLGDIHFAWAGTEYRWQGHYYRIHGPSFFVEYDNTQNGANHVHSVWRDRRDDFGVDVLQLHYRLHHA